MEHLKTHLSMERIIMFLQNLLVIVIVKFDPKTLSNMGDVDGPLVRLEGST